MILSVMDGFCLGEMEGLKLNIETGICQNGSGLRFSMSLHTRFFLIFLNICRNTTRPKKTIPTQ